MKVPLHESNRLIFVKSRGVFSDRLAYYLGIGIACIALCLILVSAGVVYADMRYQEGVADGAKKALDVHRPSEALEVACAGLWVGQQNQKYHQLQK